MPEILDVVAKERADFASEFEADGPSLGRRRGLSDKMNEYMDKLFTLKKKLAITGVRPAYILNMNPYQLKLNSVLLADEVVRACPLGQPYIIHTIKEAMFMARDDKDGDQTPIDYVPVQLIRDYEEAYYKAGGVVVFEATGNPKKPKSPEDEIAENPDLQDKIKQARSRMLAHASMKYQAAMTAFNTPGRVGYRDITDVDRNMTALLFHERMIPEKPPWFEPTKAEADIAEPCPRCKAEPKKGATMCPSCGFILDPEAAFKLGDIDPANEADKRALMRLSRVKLKELNISHLIEENLEERNANLAVEGAKQGKKEKEKKD